MDKFNKAYKQIMEANKWGKYGSELAGDGWSVFPLERPLKGTKVEVIKYIDGNKETNTKPLKGFAVDTEYGIAFSIKGKTYDSNYKFWWKRL